jgi:hypothetical protein
VVKGEVTEKVLVIMWLRGQVMKYFTSAMWLGEQEMERAFSDHMSQRKVSIR